MGLILGVRRLITKKEKKMAIVSLDDNTSRIDIAVFQETLEEYGELLQKDNIVIVEGEISRDEYTGGIKMAAKKIMTMAELRQKNVKNLTIKLTHESSQLLKRLDEKLSAFPGDVPVEIIYQNLDINVPVKISANYYVSVDDQCMNELRLLLGIEAVKFV